MPKTEILLLTSNDNQEDELIVQRIAQIKKVMPDTSVTVHCVQGTEGSVIKSSIEKIDSANYSAVILDSELAAHPWFIINDYRGQRPENERLKFIVEGNVSTLTQTFLVSQNVMGNVLVVKDGESLIEVCHGNLKGRQAITKATESKTVALDLEEKIGKDTQHNMCSIQKMLTGISILKRAEKNPDLLNRSVSDYLPDNFPQRDQYKLVTVANLLTHTSGMGDYTRKYHEVFDDETQPRPTLRSLKDFVEFADPVEGLEGQNPKQRREQYSNLGFVVLGEVLKDDIEHKQKNVATKSYWDAIEEDILIPAGARLFRDNPSSDKPFATNSAFPTTRFIASSPAGGNIWTSPEDLAKIAKWIIDQHMHDPKFKTLLRSIELKDHYAPDGSGYAFGIMQRRVDGQPVYCHGGGAPGISSDLRIYPEDNAAIIVFNNNGARAVELGQRLESNVLKAHNIHYLSTGAVIGREMRDYILPQKGEEFKTDLQLPRPSDVSSRSSTAFMSRSGIEIGSSVLPQPKLAKSNPQVVQDNNKGPKPENRADEDSKVKESRPFRRS